MFAAPSRTPADAGILLWRIAGRPSSRADGTGNNDTFRSWGLRPRRSGDPKCGPLSRPDGALSRE
ncbi:hypothetical protein PSP6_700016 [Paraburkholderia tropica]|nr:hypothetical protein PSP6_700016 [Paraburkholderia tropica]